MFQTTSWGKIMKIWSKLSLHIRLEYWTQITQFFRSVASWHFHMKREMISSVLSVSIINNVRYVLINQDGSIWRTGWMLMFWQIYDASQLSTTCSNTTDAKNPFSCHYQIVIWIHISVIYHNNWEPNCYICSSGMVLCVSACVCISLCVCLVHKTDLSW